MKIKALLLLVLLCCVETVGAEGGCPAGMYPPNPSNTSVCYPFPESQSSAPVQSPAKPQGRWETRWGAIATDTLAGAFAGVVNFSSKQSAQNAAVSQCKTNGGGKNCKIRIAFYNQCAVIASGNTFHSWQSSGTAETASGIALQKCAYKTNNCKIYYSGCILPVWISY